MSICNNFGRTLYEVIGTGNQAKVAKDYLQTFIKPFDLKDSGVWQLAVITKDLSSTLYGSLLGNPQNIDDAKVPPCSCSTSGNKVKRNVSFAYNDMSDEQEDGVYCQYCEELNKDNDPMLCRALVEYVPPKGSKKSKTNFYWPLSDPITDPPTGQGTVYSKGCCQGGCDTRAKTDDLAPKIPYLYNNYLYKFFDFKYLKQFPAIENPPLGCERVISFTSTSGAYNGITLENAEGGVTIGICADWTMKARLGETYPESEDTYHSSMYAHKKSYSRYMLTNKTAGNFILQKVNTATPISQWQKDNMPLLSTPFTDDNLEMHKIQATFGSGTATGIDNIIPKIDEFTVPYGITDDTHYNIFLKAQNPKMGSYWKWNYTSGVFFWYRYYDKDRKEDNRIFPGVDLYISDGDVLFAKNDGPEPLALYTQNKECVPKACPSGLKLTNYQVSNSSDSLTIVPSGSEFIYISANIYEKVHDITKKLFNFYSKVLPNEKTYKEIFNQAAILATSPQYDGITVDLYKTPLAYTPAEQTEFIRLINELNPMQVLSEAQISGWLSAEAEVKDIADLNLKTRLEMTNKKMVSHSKVNMVHTTGDLINTIVHKYGCYAWIPPNSSGSLIIEKPITPHATIDIDFEPVVKLSDTRNAGARKTPVPSCDILRRGSTKLFSYDQNFSIGDQNYIVTKFLDEGLVYNATCQGDPPVSRMTSVGNTISIYFREHQIFAKGFNNFQSIFEDRYSRFPSVSSTLDSTFSDLDLETDIEGNENVFFLKPDRLFRLQRFYNAIGYNQSVDLVAFHEDGGCYYDSTLLTKYPGTGTVAFIRDWRPQRTKEKPKVGFKTYDMGIKLYSVSSELLRNSKNLSCKTLPLDQACNCWGLNKIENYDYRCNTRSDGKVIYETPKLFTPFLSTRNIPLESYGGYSEQKVDSLLGDFRIPNHPSPGIKLAETDMEIDVIAVNGCKETFSVTLPNYVSTEWAIKMPDIDLTGSDLWVTYSDSLGFAGNVRNQNRISINGQEIFPNEQTFLTSPDQVLNISIYNQLLTSMFKKNPNPQVYHPSMFSCSNEQSNTSFGSNTGPSSITLTIARIPKINSLGFALGGISSAGKMKKTFFNPNIGLLKEDDPDNPKIGSKLYVNKYNGLFNFDYDSSVYGEQSLGNDTDMTFSGSISIEEASKLSRYVNLVDINKKIRLYVKIGQSWYEYEDHRTFGYYNVQENNQYHSWPTMFRETHLPTEPSLGAFIPAIPKEPLAFAYAHNIQHWANIAATKDTRKYPRADHFFTTDPEKKNRIYFNGSRMYFMLPNIKTDLNYCDNIFAGQSGTKILNMFNEDNVLYDVTPYSGGVGIGVSGTSVELESEDIVLYYVSQKDCEENLKDVDIEEETSHTPVGVPIRVKRKRIVINRNKYSEEINSKLVNNYHNIYTELELSDDIPLKKGFMGIYDNKSKIYNFTAFPTVRSFNQNYNDLITLDSQTFSNKWADLAYMNNTADTLNNRPYHYALTKAYGPFLHENIFNYIIANNHSYSYQNLLYDDKGIPDGTTTNKFNYTMSLKNQKQGRKIIRFKDPILSYYVHRDFSCDDQPANLLSRFNMYKDRNPIIDINIYNSGQKEDDAPIFDKQLIGDTGNYTSLTGIMTIKGITKPTYEYPKNIRGDRVNFFVNLNEKFRLKPVPIKDTRALYSKSFVLTDPYNVLVGMRIDTRYNDGVNLSNCSNVVLPNLVAPPTEMDSSPFDWSHYSRIYDTGTSYRTYPIYCNVDVPKECGQATVANQCTMNQVGALDVSSIYTTYLYKYKGISALKNDEIEFAFSVDAGLYCPLFPIKGQVPYIVRSEFGGYNIMNPTNTINGSSDCINGTSYPPLERGLSVWDDIYQYETQTNIIPNRVIDTWANEMIFRSIHGSKQKINLRDISKHTTEPLRSYSSILSELLNETKNNIASVYRYIPYDYDKIAGLRKIKVDGAFRILGPAKVGDKIKIVFNNNIFNIEVKDDGNAIIAECKELGVKGLIHEKFTESTSLYIREAQSETSSVIGEGISETVVDRCVTPASRSISVYCGAKAAINENAEFGQGRCSVSMLATGEPSPSDPEATGQYGAFVVPTLAYTDACPAFGEYDSFLSLPTDLISFASSFSNNVPCSAFGIESANPESQGNLDSGFSKYGASAVAGGGGSTGPMLECGQYQVYPCSVKSNCCDLKTDVAAELSYRVKNCHYDLTMKGLVSNSLFNAASYTVDNSLWSDYVCPEPRAGGKLNPKNIQDYIECCGAGSVPSGEEDPCEGRWIPADDSCCTFLANGGSTSTCGSPSRIATSYSCQENFWMISCSSPSKEYEVVQTTTRTQAPTDYLANCNRVLGIFTYDNNEVKLTLGLRKLKPVQNNFGGGQGDETFVLYNGYNCKKIKTFGCPYIRVELPSNLYGVDDYQSTQCQNCGTNPSKIEIVKNPDWVFQTDNYVCVLGTLLVDVSPAAGNLTYGMDCELVERLEYPPPNNPGDIMSPQVFGPRSCGSFWKHFGENAETEWFVSVNNPLLGNKATPGIICPTDLVAAPGYTVAAPPWTTNGASKEAYIEAWQNSFHQRFKSQYYCTNTYGYVEQDLIEGVIPGSCSLNFTTVSWPATAVKLSGTLAEDRCSHNIVQETKEGSVSVMIAYMSYRYRHPMSLEDMMIEEFAPETVNSSTCRSFYGAGLPRGNCKTGMFSGHFTNVREKLQTTKDESACSSEPVCYDKVRQCDTSQYCCKIDLYGNTYLNK